VQAAEIEITINFPGHPTLADGDTLAQHYFICEAIVYVGCVYLNNNNALLFACVQTHLTRGYVGLTRGNLFLYRNRGLSFLGLLNFCQLMN